jgi:hypothetical protein
MSNEDGIKASQACQTHVADEIEYWLNVKLQANPEGIKHLEEAAKEVIVITSFLQGIYFAAISFSDLKKVGDISNFWFDLFVMLSLFAFISWMSSLYFATRVFIPEYYLAGSSSQELSEQALQICNAYSKSRDHKYKNLRLSFNLLWISFFPLAINILIYLTMLPIPPAK